MIDYNNLKLPNTRLKGWSCNKILFYILCICTVCPNKRLDVCTGFSNKEHYNKNLLFLSNIIKTRSKTPIDTQYGGKKIDKEIERWREWERDRDREKKEIWKLWSDLKVLTTKKL